VGSKERYCAIEKLNFWIAVLLWGSVGIQIFPIYLSAKIYRAYPNVQDWSIAWIFFVLAMISVAFRRILVAASFDLNCELTRSWIIDQILMTYVNSVFFLIFSLLKQRFFIKWFSVDKLTHHPKKKIGEGRDPSG
jgi:hypothetical protein